MQDTTLSTIDAYMYIVCRKLPGNMSLTFSNGHNIDSVASYQCDNGLQQIQCGMSGWSGFLCGEINNNCSCEIMHTVYLENLAGIKSLADWPQSCSINTKTWRSLINFGGQCSRHVAHNVMI